MDVLFTSWLPGFRRSIAYFEGSQPSPVCPSGIEDVFGGTFIECY